MCSSLGPLPTPVVESSVTGWMFSAQNAPNHVMWCMMPGLCYSYSGLSLIPTSADRTCSNFVIRKKKTRHFLESLGTRRGWGDGWSSPDSTPSLSASAREVLDSHWRWQRPRRDVHPLPPTTRVPSGQTWHPSHPIRDTAVRCPLSCSVRQQGACSRRRHPRRDAGASSRPLAASKPPLTTLSFVLHGLPPPAPAPFGSVVPAGLSSGERALTG